MIPPRPLPLLPAPPEADDSQEDAAEAAAAAAAANGEIEGLPAQVEEAGPSMKELHQQQLEQAQLILSMQVAINGMSAKQNELEDEIQSLKSGRWVVKAEPTRPVARLRGDNNEHMAQTLLSVGGGQDHDEPSNSVIVNGTVQDDEIDAIIELRKERKIWPLKRKYCTSFTQEQDLLKIRFHNSDKHPHKTIRIPKVDKNEGYGLGNREGRLICRLCSGKTINRNTSWMCATCLVPLCVDIVNGDPESSCHSRWHGCHDLVSVNATLNTALRERRESKKRSRDSMNAMEEADLAAAAAVLQAAVPLSVPVVEPMKVEIVQVQEHPDQQVINAAADMQQTV